MNETMGVARGEVREDKYSIDQILDDMYFGKIVNHERNRDSDQWQPAKKTKLIDSILRAYPITPIMAVQNGTGSDAVLKIVDGGQRLSTIDEFKKNRFKLGKTKPIWIKVPKMVDKLDENGNVVKELLPGKKRRTPVKVYELGADGKPVHEMKKIKLSNKFYKDLPVELQKAFMRFKNIVVINMINYSEEEVREVMLRFNMSVPMNPAQAGVIACSDQAASFIQGFRQHDLFKNCSTWTSKEILKDAIERCITEAYILMYMPDVWGGYPKHVELFNTTATEDSFDEIREMADKLALIIGENDAIIDNLCNKNMYITLANFKNFYDMRKYKLSDYAKFLCDWFMNIKDESGYNLFDEKSTKSKAFVLGRLEIMNEELNKWLAVNGTVADDSEYADDDDEGYDEYDNTSDPDDDDLWGNTPENNSNTIDSNTVELNVDADAANEQTQTTSTSPTTEVESQPEIEATVETKLTESKPSTETIKIHADMTELTNHDVVRRLYNQEPGYVKDYMTKAMMAISDMNGYHFKGYSDKYIQDYINEFNNQPASDRDTQVDDCKYYLDCLDGYLINVPSDSDFITDENMLCLMNVIKSAQSNETDDDTIRDWVIKFVDEYDEHSRFANMSSDNHDYVIMGKISYLSSELSKYISDLWVDGM